MNRFDIVREKSKGNGIKFPRLLGKKFEDPTLIYTLFYYDTTEVTLPHDFYLRCYSIINNITRNSHLNSLFVRDCPFSIQYHIELGSYKDYLWTLIP